MKPNSTKGTIFFVHRGTLEPYLQAAILQARFVDSQSRIVLLGDQPRDTIPPWLLSEIQYEPLSDYSARANGFAETFRFEGNNQFHYELGNFQRWFLVCSYLQTHKLGGPALVLDSDSYLYLSMDKVLPSLISTMSVVDKVGPQFTFFVNFDAIVDFTTFLSLSFATDEGFRALKSFVRDHAEAGVPHVSDMVAFGVYAKLWELDDLGKPDRDDFIFCENIGSSQGLQMNVLGKKISLRNGQRFFTRQDGLRVLAGGVHLQGGNKVLWPYFVDKQVNQALRNSLPKEYRIARKRARTKALVIGLMKASTSLRHLVSRPKVAPSKEEIR